MIWQRSWCRVVFKDLIPFSRRNTWSRRLFHRDIMDQQENEKEPFIIDTDSQTTVREGQASVKFPGVRDVFYNPVQEFNRDLSIAVLRLISLDHLQKKDPSTAGETYLKPGKVYENGITILEALAASGLRSIRYAKEVGGVQKIVANDMSISAVESIERNAKSNEVSHLVHPNEGDACAVMYQHKHKSKFECVDIDPYGSPSPFIDAAVQCVADGGLLMVTATDMAILCGNLPESCYAKYGSISLKNRACHEMALRIILQCIQSSAARYGRYIHPLLSVSVDFYVRIFMLVYTGKKECKSAASKMSMVYQCVNCHTLVWQPLMTLDESGNKFSRAYGPPTTNQCGECQGRLQLGGPFWSEPIHDMDFVSSLLTSLDNPEAGPLKTVNRIRGILSVINEELPDVPLYQAADRMSSFLKLPCPSLVEFRSAILNAGHRVSLSHCCKQSIKTDAPPAVLWDIMRCFAQKQFPNKVWPRPPPTEGTASAADRILSQEPKIKADFTVHPQANPESRKQKLVRFQENPEKNWGPKARAKSSVRRDAEEEKRSRKQNKKRRLDAERVAEASEIQTGESNN